MSLFSLSNLNFNNMIHYSKIEMEENKATFILGKSGTGKSTLLKLLNASVSPMHGEILYKNKPLIQYDTIALRREITLVSQSVFLFDDTIRNNFAEFYHYRELPPPNESTILTYLQICRADFPLETTCQEMSGGERQRIFLAICLSFMPKVLLLDEPTSALDEHTSKMLMENLKRYCKEKSITLIVVSHDKLLAERYADEIINLDSEVQHE